MPGRGRHLCQLGTCRGRCRQRAARRSSTPWQPPVGTDTGCWDPWAAESPKGPERGIWARHRWGSSCLGCAMGVAAAHGATPPCQWLFALPGDLGLSSSLCQASVLPSKFWGLAGPSPAPSQASMEPSALCHCDRDSTLATGHPRAAPSVQQHEGFTPPHQPTGWAQGPHMCPLPGSSGMKEWPTVPA